MTVPVRAGPCENARRHQSRELGLSNFVDRAEISSATFFWICWMVGCFSERVPFYIDVWAGGRFIELEEMSSYLGLSSDECSGSVLLPVTIGETLARACRNLTHHYALRGEKKEAEMFQDFVVEFEKTLKIEPHAP